MTTSSYDGPITNIIVVMLENRSYDNILGALYMASTPPPEAVELKRTDRE